MKVREAGIPVCVIVRVFAAPSASVAVAVIVAIGLPSVPPAVAGAVMTGAWFVFAIVRRVVALPVPPAPSVTDHTMLYVPAEPTAGVPETVAVRGDAPGA